MMDIKYFLLATEKDSKRLCIMSKWNNVITFQNSLLRWSTYSISIIWSNFEILHNFNYGFVLFKILLKHIRYKPIWCAHGSKVYQIKGKFTIRKETIQIQIFPMESWLPLNHHQLSWIFVLVVEEYACVVTCVPYYINCIVYQKM